MTTRAVVHAAGMTVDALTISVSEAASRLGVDREALQSAAKRYAIPAVVFRGVYRIPLNWVERAESDGVAHALSRA